MVNRGYVFWPPATAGVIPGRTEEIQNNSQVTAALVDNVLVQSLSTEDLLQWATPALFTLLFLLPVSALMVRLVRSKRRYEDSVENSFEEMPLRAPGESLRLKIEELSRAQQQMLRIRLVLAVTGALIVSGHAAARTPLVLGVIGLVVLVDLARTTPKILLITDQLWNARLAFRGKRVVAEELNRSMALGYQTFHDIPFETYHIDHVIIGPAGVFCVVTKTRYKSRDLGEKADRPLRYDGDSLHWPRYKDLETIDQARHNVRTLAHWLSSTTGAPVRVQGIVTVPGWTVEDCDKHPIWVLDPKRIKPFLQQREEHLYSNEHLERIHQQLTERCRLKTRSAAALRPVAKVAVSA